MGIEAVKLHFEKEAKAFDMQIRKLIPNYEEMIQVLVDSLALIKKEAPVVIDLGCGTGTVSGAVLQKYPNAKITCVDIAKKMLVMARNKLGDSCTYRQADLNHFEFDQEYDMIISSLALHHLSNVNDKQRMYDKIYKALRKDGIFINFDVILGDNDLLQKMNMKRWIAFMLRNVSEKEVNEKWLPAHYSEDKPVTLRHHFEMMQKSGFSAVDVLVKQYGYCVYCGLR